MPEQDDFKQAMRRNKQLDSEIVEDVIRDDAEELRRDVDEDIAIDERMRRTLAKKIEEQEGEIKAVDEAIIQESQQRLALQKDINQKIEQLHSLDADMRSLEGKKLAISKKIIEEEKARDLIEEDEVLDKSIERDEEIEGRLKKTGGSEDHEVEEDERRSLSKKLRIDRDLDEEEEQIERE